MQRRESVLRALCTAALVLLLAAGMPAALAAQSVESAHPEKLANEVPAGGTLVGSRAGAFHYYAIDYPGDLRVVTFEMDFTPANPVTRSGVGFNVYGPNGYFIGQGEPLEDGDDAALQLRYSDGNEATWLVQVYNYIPGESVNYAIVARGFPEPPKACVTVLDQTFAGGTVAIARVTSPGPGWIVIHAQQRGEPGPIVGYRAVAAGTSSDVTVPVDATLTTDTLYAMLHIDAGTLGTFEFPGPDVPATVNGQVVSPSFSIAPTPGPGPEDGAVLQLGESVSGTLLGKSAGAFARYDLIYAGDGARVEVRLDFYQDTPAVGQGIGLVIYGPSGEVARAKGAGQPGERTATFSSRESGDYLVQVYNYIDGFALPYAVTRHR